MKNGKFSRQKESSEKRKVFTGQSMEATWNLSELWSTIQNGSWTQSLQKVGFVDLNATTRRQWMAFDLAKRVPKKGVVFVDHFRHFRSRMYLGLVRCSNSFDFQ